MTYKTHDELMEETRQQRHSRTNIREEMVEARQKEVDSMNRLCFQLLGADEGAKLLDYLERMCVGSRLLQTDGNGKVDGYSTVATARAREIFDSIRQMIKYGEKAK